ncbi:MAG: glutathione S-transferase family protein [Polyangiales bacterium]
MKLYTNLFSPNARKVHALAQELDIELEAETVDLRAGQHRTPEYLALNPNGKVPTLVDGETKLWESNAIMCYLAATRETPMWPKSPARYEILRWMFWESNHFSNAIARIIGQKIFRRDNADQAIVDSALKDVRRYAAVLDQTLHGSHFIIGDTLTLADLAVGVGLGYTDSCELPTAEFQHVSRWWGALRDTPVGQTLMPPESHS